ncbi:MAG: [acyl-carrier-protein] S-malonyltransferase [Candidatus Tokpelaia sp.]|nr:MAG: [acyl-carrier-protein] S-malonyltransferase [Candidatus Tokpelaia sp.]KAA6207686.1 MAG: [acyl-carrier-protein] S-malonyltransferase [Candidatus Tokpelaia sp.]
MGKALAENFAAARYVFEEVDEALKQKLSSIIFTGSEEELTLTANAQPALMAVSLAVLRIMEAQGLVLADKISYVAGHSLGEYSALCAAGAFSVAETARLLRIRGNAMQAAVPAGQGAMAAIIGLDNAVIAALCREVAFFGICQIANDNGGGQTVISGAKRAVEEVVLRAQQKGARRALLLPVSGPFHSALMEPAANIMKESLAKAEKKPPSVPLIANISAAPETNSDRIAALLVEQITGLVRWREIMEWFAAHNVHEIYEIGAGRVLTGLAKRSGQDLSAMAVGTPGEIEKALASLLA